VLIPGKLLAGICFPQAIIENEVPHMTLLKGDTEANYANEALKATCLAGGIFSEQYEMVKKKKMPHPDSMTGTVSIQGNEEKAYFIACGDIVTIEGVTQKYFK